MRDESTVRSSARRRPARRGSVLRVLAFVAAALCVCAAARRADCAEVDLEKYLSRPGPTAPDEAFARYRAVSDEILRATSDTLLAELRSLGLSDWSAQPPEGKKRFEWGDPPEAWYGGPEALALAENIVSYQLPCGGWAKNIDAARGPRQPGERPYRDWGPVGTFDNQATWKHMRFLARVYCATGKDTLRGAFVRGLRYVFAAQYPSGGWPQVYPLIGGYHDRVTLNDGVLPGVLGVVRDVARGAPGFDFVPEPERQRAKESLDRAIDCVLKCQIVVQGRRTAWSQQFDPVTFAPATARSYEIVALASLESALLLEALMDVPDPSPELAEAVRSGMEWLQAREIRGQRWQWTDEGPMAVADPEAPPIWARYYEIGTDRPVFCDRDGTVHYDVNKVSKERRRFYAWYVSFQLRPALEKYPAWRERNPGPTAPR